MFTVSCEILKQAFVESVSLLDDALHTRKDGRCKKTGAGSHIINLVDCVERGGVMYMVMELLHGGVPLKLNSKEPWIMDQMIRFC